MAASFVIQADNGKFYTGKAGDAWLGERSEAFAMGEGEAARKAELFNGRSRLTGLTFKAEAA